MERTDAYAVIAVALDSTGLFVAPALAQMTERHYFEMPIVQFKPATDVLSASAGTLGTVFMMDRGLPSRAQLAAMKAVLDAQRRIFIYWPGENAIEAVDAERLGSLRRHHLARALGVRLKAWRDRRRAPIQAMSGAVSALTADAALVQSAVEHIGREAEGLDGHLKGAVTELRQGSTAISDQISAHTSAVENQLQAARAALSDQTGTPAHTAVRDALVALSGISQSIPAIQALGTGMADHIEGGLPVLERVRHQSAAAANDLTRLAAPAVISAPADIAGPYTEADLPAIEAFLRSIADNPRPVPFPLDTIPSAQQPIPGTGLYLRLDFWTHLTSGGSYGHTCYQAHALAETTRDFVSVTSSRYDLLDDLGVRQVIVPGRDMTQTEANLLGMNRHYCDQLGVMFDAMRPAYIFERAVLGNAVGAWASRRYNIPYIVEYNGSEIAMKRSFAGEGYAHEKLLLLAEDAAFRQASLISVVSDHVAAEVAERGIPESKIFVNPNAVDPVAYAPGTAEEVLALRTALGFSKTDRVVGFIGTFGGWHGIDVLCASLPAILAAHPDIKFLLIGDGHLKHQVTGVIAEHRLQDRVVDVGRVPQMRGAELLRACDILISPHSSGMLGKPFFGSPTKLFEYMAVGAGIVASDLEQIAHVLSPALRTSDFASAKPDVTNQRAVLCPPGSVEDFIHAVLALARDSATTARLGANARAAALAHYTWSQHVRNLWLRLAGQQVEGYALDRAKQHAP